MSKKEEILHKLNTEDKNYIKEKLKEYKKEIELLKEKLEDRKRFCEDQVESLLISFNTIKEYYDEVFDSYWKLKKAKKLKYAIGQQVYTIDEYDNSVVPFEIEEIRITEDGIKVKSVEWEEWFNECEFFTTRQEADQVAEGLNNG